MNLEKSAGRHRSRDKVNEGSKSNWADVPDGWGTLAKEEDMGC